MKDCESCKYENAHSDLEPCCSCSGDYSNWESAEDVVNHPNHYNREGSVECIDEMLSVFGAEAVRWYCLLNVWKYRYRAYDKNGEEDIQKSDWYMKKYMELSKDVHRR